MNDKARNDLRPRAIWLWMSLLGLITVAIVAWGSQRIEHGLGEPARLSGYALFTIMVLLALFNLRKKLPMLPLPRARSWLILHVVFGLVALVGYWLHTDVFWPTGGYEQVLALTFYLVSLSGVLGFVLQSVIPPRLSQIEGEYLFERMPAELAAQRDQAEAIVLAAAEQRGNDTLGRYYIESLEWFFRRPRFLASHLWGSSRAERWIAGHVDALDRYLSDDEREHLLQLHQVAMEKNRLDAQYAMQGLMKLWLLAHVPLALLTLLLATWHLLLVNIYVL